VAINRVDRCCVDQDQCFALPPRPQVSALLTLLRKLSVKDAHNDHVKLPHHRSNRVDSLDE
jgi:hypothetical protein